LTRLNHMIVPSTDHKNAAEFLAMLLGAEVSPATGEYPWSPSLRVGDVKILFCKGPFTRLHLAFHVTPDEFDGILERIREHGVAYGDSANTPNNSRLRVRDLGNRTFWTLAPDKTLLEFFSFDELPEGLSSPA
jgi:hypothetical protein